MTGRHVTTVGDLMSRVVHTVRETDKIRTVHALLRASRVRHAAIVDEAGVLRGVVAERDLLFGWSHGAAASVAEVMSRHTHWARPCTLARDAAERMLHHRIGCLPVVDDHNHVIGILTDTDLIQLALRALTVTEVRA